MSFTAPVKWLHPDRALPADPSTRAIARVLLERTQDLPIVSMHGHVEPEMLAANAAFVDPTNLLITPDHYLIRMLVSQGMDLSQFRPQLGEPAPAGEAHSRKVWALLAQSWHLFRGTPTRLWLEHVLADVFELPEPLSAKTQDVAYDHIAERLTRPDYRPRALFERFNLEVIATTDAAESPLNAHAQLANEGWGDRVLPTFRPDPLLEIADRNWNAEVDRLAAAAGHETGTYTGYVEALRLRRQAFIAAGARATDHSHAVADTTPLSPTDAARIYADARIGKADLAAARAFTGHMLFQMAAMSSDDGLVMQIHHGVVRGHDRLMTNRYGANIGFDIPTGLEFTWALRPLLEAFGHHPRFRMVAFTIDEAVYSRELAPLAGAYPALRLGAPWWFLDAPDAMRRFRETTVETAGFYNTSGFVDDTRAFCSIPARHDLARRIDAGYLAKLVVEHRLPLDEAGDTAVDLAYNLPKISYPSPLEGSRERVVPNLQSRMHADLPAD